MPSNTSDDDDDPYYYYYKARKNRSKFRKRPVPSTKKGKDQPNINLNSQDHCPATSDSGITDITASKNTCIFEGKQLRAAEDQAESLNPADGDVPQSTVTSPCNSSDYRFECICGELDQVDRKPRVQCLKCHLWQHAKCVNYEEKNLKIKPFYCPHCLVAMEPVSTRATLIISPSSICHQWVDEINRHVRSSSLRVLVRQSGLLKGIGKCQFLLPCDNFYNLCHVVVYPKN